MIPQEDPQNPRPRQNPVQPSQNDDNQPQIVYMARPHEPVKPEISPEVQRKAEESRRKYPGLNLSDGEFVISAVKRHWIGLLQIWIGVGVIILVLIALGAILASSSFVTSPGAALTPTILAVPFALVGFLVLLFGFVASSIYSANEFFLTNESVIQMIQTGIFAKREQTVSLANIEDASYTQNGILPHIFNYGMIRLSTEGDETTYRFNFASNPRKTIAVLNNAVEAFKNGRPISMTDN